MIDVATLITILGVPANIAVVGAALWLIDRRLVRIETALFGERREHDPYPEHATDRRLRL